VAKFDPFETPPEQAGEGVRRLRDRAMKIREEVRRERPPGTKEERARLAGYLADFARELRDEAPLASSVTRALNAFRAAGVPPERWAEHLYQARSITQRRSASIGKQINPDAATYPGPGPKSKMAYYFAVLDDLLGLRPPPPAGPPGPRREGGVAPGI
jgi:hypothetical protein